MFRLYELANVAKNAGLTFSSLSGWQTAGDGDMHPTIRGVLFHDTAGRPPPDDHPSLPTVIHGRPGVPGPLANFFLARSGTFTIVAAGKANHAGMGKLDGVQGIFNRDLIGIEAENVGVAGTDPWPEVQLIAGAKMCAALATFYKFPLAKVMGHKEYACFDDGRPGRKVDPDFDMDAFRARVAQYLTP